jgi:predicted DNA-binding protein with PD1-like motif
MHIKKLDNAYLLRLDYGEELIASLIEFSEREEVEGGFFHGMGGATSAVLGIYLIESEKRYHFNDFAGPLEILSVNGNIAMVGDERMVHAHATISGPDLNVSGGHVKEIVVGGTCEIFVDLRTGTLNRRMDESVGLNLLMLDDD